MIVSDFLKTIFKTLSFIRCFLPWEEFSHGFLQRRSQQIPHPNGRRRLRDTSAARSWMRKWPICSLAFRWLLRCFFLEKNKLILPGVMIPNPFLFGLMGWKYQSVGLCIVVVEMIHRWILHHFAGHEDQKDANLGIKENNLGYMADHLNKRFLCHFF